jgi:acyl-CoA synthetase (AMP-forming)/AMP-acid ligase II
MRIIDFFDRAVALHPGNIFLRQGDISRYYDESAAATHRIAAALQRDGIPQTAPVGFYMPNDWRGVEALYGVFRAGNPASPVNSRNAVAQNAALLKAVGARVLFFHSCYADEAETVAAACPELRLLICLDRPGNGHPALADWMAPEGAQARPLSAQPGDTWAIFGTSGTTGDSKHVIQTHQTGLALTWDMLFAMRLQEPVRHLVVAPVSHFAGSFLFALAAIGSTHYLHDKVDVVDIMTAIERDRIEVLFLPPTVIYMMLAHPRLHDFDYGSLKYLVYAGAPMARAKLREAISAFGPVMMNMFGQTEANGPIAFLRPEEHRLDAGPVWDWRLQSIGRASITRQIAIMADDGTLLGPHQAGEMVICGMGNCAGYLNNPAATEELFRHGWLHTGDVGMMDEEGYVVLVDRKKDMIVTGGLNVFSAEVERVLMSHPAVLDAVVIGVPDAKWGEAVKGVVELKPGASVSEAELIALCRAELGGVKTPKSIEFRSELPRNATGKILKREVRKPYWIGQERNI